MRLQRNPGSITALRFVFNCIACGQRTDNTQEWFADLDGEPFKAYYCQTCGNTHTIRQARKEHHERATH